MEITQFRGFSELSGIEDPCFNSQWPFNSFDDQLMNVDACNSFAYAPMFDHIHYKPIMEASPRPSKQLKTSSWNSSISSDQSMMNQTIHYGSDHSHVANQATLMSPKEEATLSSSSVFQSSSHVQFGNQNHHAKKINSSKFTTPQDHIMAERKRREKLSQKFIALSALIPGLKKMDKASVLGDAIKYLKNLQEKVKTLEEQTKKRSNVESVVFVKRYEVLGDGGEISSSGENSQEQLPEIEARFSGKDVLIRVHCEKKAGIVEEILAEIEKLHLSVINSTALTFANYALDITLVATMDQEFTMTMKDLVKNLRIGLKRLM
ncbi:Myc-type, basic helix-loop-helix (bHLH) domain-containing protein [Artemisia annua]|uniref:Myc-type, basic helix-loop-helix (BHLH) domain-containing protein n=1 Tax=Artemisia annua TaxID=35608 RepID=A0A2U1NYV1_ARTAN|nr:Myc-type, basic helix-loop-helix (bHLH) domain-containing protein [Artemisia annua]